MNNLFRAQLGSSSADQGLSVRVLRSVPQLEGIRTAWESWPGYRDSDMDFYLTVLRSSPDAVRPHVIAIYRDGQPDAILVGRLDKTKVDFRVGYFHVTPTADILYFVNGALRGNQSIKSIELLVKNICSSLDCGEADAAYLNFLPTDSDMYRLARTIPRFLSRDYASASQPHFCTSIRGSVEEFYKTLSPRSRHHARTRRKTLLKNYPGAVRIRCFRHTSEIDTLVHDVEQIARVSYQRGLGVGFRDNPETRERLHLAARKDWLHGYVLYISERPCAYLLGDLSNGQLCVDYVGYDPAFAKHSVGMYLITEVIEGFCSDGVEGVTEVDYEPGYAQYKQVLSTREWQEASVYIFAPSLKGFELNLVRSLTAGIHDTLKQSLGRTPLWNRIKRRWRRHTMSDHGGSVRTV